MMQRDPTKAGQRGERGACSARTRVAFVVKVGCGGEGRSIIMVVLGVMKEVRGKRDSVYKKDFEIRGCKSRVWWMW